MSASSTTTVYVTAAAPTDPPPSGSPSSRNLNARGYKTKGSQRADLSWNGFTGASLDIYRNGTLIKTTGNDGSDTDSINRKGGGTYTYRACEGGTGNCSNDAQVVF